MLRQGSFWAYGSVHWKGTWGSVTPTGLDMDMLKYSCHTKTWTHSGTSIKIRKEKKAY